jgi:hypothetical protein
MKLYDFSLLKYGIVSVFVGIVFINPALFIIGLLLTFFFFKIFYSSGYRKASGNDPFATFSSKANTGEYHIFTQIEKLGFKSIFTNIYIPQTDEDMTEVDIIATHNSGIYVFEIKNYSGWIHGNEYMKMWTQTLNRHTKNSFYNPIRQNYGHIESLKKYLEIDEPEAFHSYIVFTSKSELKNITKKSSDDIICLTKEDLIKDIVKKHLSDRKEVFSNIELKTIDFLISTKCLQDKSVKDKHLENIKRKLEK